MTLRRSALLALVLSLGLIVLLRPPSRAASADAAMGNCYSDTKDYSTPTMCE
jgi:hypothetical protein